MGQETKVAEKIAVKVRFDNSEEYQSKVLEVQTKLNDFNQAIKELAEMTITISTETLP